MVRGVFLWCNNEIRSDFLNWFILYNEFAYVKTFKWEEKVEILHNFFIIGKEVKLDGLGSWMKMDDFLKIFKFVLGLDVKT